MLFYCMISGYNNKGNSALRYSAKLYMNHLDASRKQGTRFEATTTDGAVEALGRRDLKVHVWARWCEAYRKDTCSHSDTRLTQCA